MKSFELCQSVLNQLYTLYLFIASDMKTIILPSAILGFCHSVAGSAWTLPLTKEIYHVMRLPIVFVWLLLNLLPITISNQLRPDSVLEDRINKPWRAIPSHRISPSSANHLMWLFGLLSFFISFYHGNETVWLMLMVGNWPYNHRDAANRNFIVRNLANAAAFVLYALGATRVVMHPFELPEGIYKWLALLAFVIATTVHTQDFPDREGDKARGRRTMPLVLGDIEARWTVVVPALLWSAILPLLWGSGVLGYTLTCMPGLALALRIILFRTQKADEQTWKLWTAWITSLYALPLTSRIQISQISWFFAQGCQTIAQTRALTS